MHGVFLFSLREGPNDVSLRCGSTLLGITNGVLYMVLHIGNLQLAIRIPAG